MQQLAEHFKFSSRHVTQRYLSVAHPIRRSPRPSRRVLRRIGVDDGNFVLIQFYRNNFTLSFTALLRAFGMIEQKEEKSTDGRRKLAEKSFHSIRHAFVTWGRGHGGFTADVIRETVGHDSEAVERDYFTCALDLKEKVLAAAADAVKAAPIAYSMQSA